MRSGPVLGGTISAIPHRATTRRPSIRRNWRASLGVFQNLILRAPREPSRTQAGRFLINVGYNVTCFTEYPRGPGKLANRHLFKMASRIVDGLPARRLELGRTRYKVAVQRFPAVALACYSCGNVQNPWRTGKQPRIASEPTSHGGEDLRYRYGISVRYDERTTIGFRLV